MYMSHYGGIQTIFMYIKWRRRECAISYLGENCEFSEIFKPLEHSSFFWKINVIPQFFFDLCIMFSEKEFHDWRHRVEKCECAM